MRKLLSAIRRPYLREAYQVFCLPLEAPRVQSTLSFVGLNALHEPQDGELSTPLGEPYDGFTRDGDAGLIAFTGMTPMGWAWLKTAPYEEPLGCGRIAYERGLRVLRYFEVGGQHRGKGLGHEILAEMTRRLLASNPEGVVALVGLNNRASTRCFERLGYRRQRNVIVARLCGIAMTSRLSSSTCLSDPQ